MFIGYGGNHFKNGTAEPNVNTPEGVKAFKYDESIIRIYDPDFLTHDSNATNEEFRAGNVMLMNMWGKPSCNTC